MKNAKKNKTTASRKKDMGVSLKLGIDSEDKSKEESTQKTEKTRAAPVSRQQPASNRSKADMEINHFKKAHKECGASAAVVTKNDKHVTFSHIKKDIEQRLNQTPNPFEARDDIKVGKLPKKGQIDGMKIMKTGIHGLDDILGGGLPEEGLILLSGTCGTGKSVFGMNFLIEGAMKDEPGIYISLEQSPEANINQMKMLGWPVEELMEKNKIMILQPELYKFDALLTAIEDSVNTIKAKRLVIDSVSIIGMYFEDPYKVRKSLLQLSSLLKKLNCTTIAIDEINEGDNKISAYGVEEFIVDGIIILYLIKKNNMFIRAIVIRKMRGMKHSNKIHPLEIKKPEGIVIYPTQEMFEEIS